uniref:V-SNARE coiled-coil homology domain-containing protein n=1 Tax=Meloidogyne floridensis TaxID=298350 RepID=A0A915NNN9_9BILA
MFWLNSNILSSLTQCQQLAVSSIRGIARIPHWEYHIRFDPKVGRKRPAQDVLDRFRRLNNGMWIRARAGRTHANYMKEDLNQMVAMQWETCTKSECHMLDKMMTPFWLRQRHYVNDDLEPFHTRYGITGPRVNCKKKLTRERPKILLDDLTSDRFFDRLPASMTKSRLAIDSQKSDLPKLLKDLVLRRMKLLSIMILHKNPSLGQTRLLKGEYELGSFSFFTKRNAQEFMQFTAKLVSDRSATPSRSTIKEGEYFVHYHYFWTELEYYANINIYQSRVAFALLNKVLADFSDRIPQSLWASIQSERDCNYDQLPMFLTKWQNPREADALTRVQDEVEETKVVLHNTMQSVLERGEKLDDLIKASENLSDQSKLFYTQARKMNKCCNYV